jgi:phosphoglycolate phosphatase
MKYKAIIIDLDGTLLDTLDDLADSMNLTLKRMGLPAHPVKNYKTFVGDGVDVLARRALPSHKLDDGTIEQCIKMMRTEYATRMFHKTKPYEGIPDLLDGLTKQCIAINVLSNKPDDLTKALVKKLLPDWTFAIIAGAQPGIPKKPSPVAPLSIAHFLTIKPPKFIYLGDTGTDMGAANAAGMYPVGALWGFRTAKELKSFGAKALVKTPIDVLDIIK